MTDFFHNPLYNSSKRHIISWAGTERGDPGYTPLSTLYLKKHTSNTVHHMFSQQPYPLLIAISITTVTHIIMCIPTVHNVAYLPTIPEFPGLYRKTGVYPSIPKKCFKLPDFRVTRCTVYTVPQCMRNARKATIAAPRIRNTCIQPLLP